MAKTKEDFYKEGQKSARISVNIHSHEQDPYAMPAFGEGSSWQARAFAEGFNAELKKVKQYRKRAVIIPEYVANVFMKFPGRWAVVSLSGEVIGKNIKRKTHARNIAERLGYKIVT